MPKGIKRKLFRAINRVQQKIRLGTDQNSLYSRGLSTEGYWGGYYQSLNDVVLMLNGVPPNRHSDLWEDDPGP